MVRCVQKSEAGIGRKFRLLVSTATGTDRSRALKFGHFFWPQRSDAYQLWATPRVSNRLRQPQALKGRANPQSAPYHRQSHAYRSSYSTGLEKLSMLFLEAYRSVVLLLPLDVLHH